MLNSEVYPRRVSQRLQAASERLQALAGEPLREHERVAVCVQVAEALHAASRAGRSASERRRDAMLAALMADSAGQAFSTLLTDRVYRSDSAVRVARTLAQLVSALGIPAYLGWANAWLLRAGVLGRWVAPAAVAAGVRRTLRAQGDGLTLPAEAAALAGHLDRRRAQGVQMNLNRLGEAVLGEDEAEARVQTYEALLAEEPVRTVSVKVSSIASQLDLLGFEHTLDVLRPRLRRVYRAAMAGGSAGRQAKLVNFDMEAYRDLELTYALFTSVLREPEFMGLTAGLVLQAYLPDSAEMQRRLLAWASARVADGGAPVRMRIVKGANLAHEAVDASLYGWPLPIYASKAEVDANFKRMLDVALEPAHAAVVRLGVASHNPFELAYALTRAHERGVQAHMQVELLEGMADPLRRALQGLGADVLLYGPVVGEAEMQSAIAYLVRRLDENTAPENFLHDGFAMDVGDAKWQRQQAAFEAACAARGQVGDVPLRTQDRGREAGTSAAGDIDAGFDNEPDTDFGREQNRDWAEALLARFHDMPVRTLAADGHERRPGATTLDGFDPSRPGYCPYRFELADPAQVEATLARARAASTTWGGRGVRDRARCLAAAGAGLRGARAELIGAMVLDAGKRLSQADSEVSEAIDFCEFYLRSALAWAEEPCLALRPRGVILVTPPWNFPLAIPAGGVLSALAAGNSVILKPALETVLVAEQLCQVLWDAGIPPDALQLCVCRDELGSKLVRDPRVDCVILTGAAATARLFLDMRPDLHMLAETGGKNALIVTAMADRDQAAFDAVHGAFGHAGQKCSATSLLICEAEVHDDPAFAKQLRDAAASLPVGSAWEAHNVVTPLIHPPAGALGVEISALDAGQRWLLQPEVSSDNPRLVSPGIKLGVGRGQRAHRTELFGPMLGVMRAKDLHDAIDLANDTPYGLTSGLHSLDEVEQAVWRRRIAAGNLYVGRGTTGAIVQRQPFGGWRASGFGPGAKAGGPNYVLRLSRIGPGAEPALRGVPDPLTAELIVATQRHLPAAQQSALAAAACEYGHARTEHIGHWHDPSALTGELNLFGYQPCAPMVVRAAADASLLAVLRACAAALTAGAGFALSCEQAWAARHPFVASLPHIGLVEESDEALGERIDTLQRIRVVGRASVALRAAARAAGVHCAEDEVRVHGRVELLHYVREQTVSVSYHRYGNLAGRALQPPT